MLCGDFTLASNSISTIKTRFLEVTGQFDADLVGVEDWDLMLRLAEQGPFAHIRDPLTTYREHSGVRVSMTARGANLAKAADKWGDYPSSGRFFKRLRAEVAFNNSRLAGLQGDRRSGWRHLGQYLQSGWGTPGFALNVSRLAILNGAGATVYRRLQGINAS
jgi:hypothetical protein